MKRFLAAVLLLVLALCLTGCQESSESKYNRAGKLLTEGKYDEAARLLDEISTYEDASRMAVYGKALAAAESGDYKAAVSGFKALGDYRDSPMMSTYCTARQYESQATEINWSPRVMAAEVYDTVALFRDSKDRAESCRKTVYDKAVSYAETQQYVQSMEMLTALRDYKDSAMLRRYYEAFRLEQEDRMTEASRTFAALGDYRDSKAQATEVLKRGYQKADGLERLGKQEDAYRIFINLAEGEYEDSYERANKPYYDLGLSLREEKKWPDAIAAFEHAGTYSDAETQAKEIRYMQAVEKREQHNWDAAIGIFTALGDYRDSTTVQINETNYQKADALEKSGDREAAYELFISLGRYRDSFARANKPYYDLGVAKREAGEWDAAVAAFEHAGRYSDAPGQIPATRYAEGEAKRAAGDWDGAVAAFEQAGEYSDAAEQIPATRYAEGKAKRAAKDWDGAAAVFKALGEYHDAPAQVFETRYQEASALEAEGRQKEAHDLFLSLGDYHDSFERAQKPYYDLGIARREAGEWDEAVEAFKMADAYSDAVTQIAETRYQEAAALEVKGEEKAAHDLFLSLGDYRDSFARANKPYYDTGLARREAGDWDGAVAAFEQAGTYEDAAEQIQATRYAEGEAKRAAQDWDGARQAFLKAGEYKDSDEQVKETTRREADSFYSAGDYERAYDLYLQIRDYQDTESLLMTDAHLAAAARIAPYRIPGNVVTFGRYEQDRDTGNGTEPIEWIVLDVQDGKALLLSRYGLDAVPYNTERTAVTWERCTLRAWLNGEFLNKAFSTAEQSAILITEVDNSQSQGYSGWDTDGGNNTRDQVFLLSYAEANRYLGVRYGEENAQSRIAPTAYALARSALISESNRTADGTPAGWWWLRSPGSIQDSAVRVNSDGSFYANHVDDACLVVRPALWLNPEIGIF